MSGYWPWWLASLVLSGLVVSFRWIARKSMGPSGAWYRVLRQPRVAATTQIVDMKAFQEAMLAATLAQFGPMLDQLPPAPETAPATAGELPASAPASCEPVAASSPTPWSADLLFLVMLVVGGWAAAAMSGGWSLRLDQGIAFARLFGSGWHMAAALFGGGLLIGFGTTMAGGCTVGHGLGGCGSFQKGSLLAMTVFFGTAVGCSLLLEWWIK